MGRSIAWWAAQAVDAVRRPILRRTLRRTRLRRVCGLSLLVTPGVFDPVVFRSGELLAEAIADLPRVDAAPALDLGTGSGLQALAAARRGYRVDAVDIHPPAVACARANAVLNGLEDRVTVTEGDLFSAYAGRRYDLVISNPPFFPGRPNSDADRAWRSTDILDRLAAGLPGALVPKGFALVVFSDQAEDEALLSAWRRNGLTVKRVRERRWPNERLSVYRLEAA